MISSPFFIEILHKLKFKKLNLFTGMEHHLIATDWMQIHVSLNIAHIKKYDVMVYESFTRDSQRIAAHWDRDAHRNTNQAFVCCFIHIHMCEFFVCLFRFIVWNSEKENNYKEFILIATDTSFSSKKTYHFFYLVHW